MGEWTLLSNHGHVLVCLARNHEARLRDVAADVGITERAVQNILRELQQAGMVTVNKHGRCNHYQINLRKSLRHPLEAHCTVGNLLRLLKVEGDGAATATPDNDERAEPSTPKPTAPNPSAAKPSATLPKVDKPVAAKPIANKPEASKPEAAKPATQAARSKPVAAPEAKADKPARKGKAKTKPKTEEPAPSSQQGSLF